MSVLVSVLVIISLTVSVSAVAVKSSTETVRYQKDVGRMLSTFPYTETFETCTTAGAPCPPPVGWTSVAPALQSSTGTQNHTPGGAWSIRINAAGTGVLTSDTVNYTGYINPDVSFWFRGTSTAKGTTNLYYSISGGPWVLIFTQTPWDNDSAFHQYTVSNITALNGQSSVKFKWEFVRTAGTSNSIDDIQFTADASATAPTVTTNAATPVGTTTATLNGDVTSDGGTTITERGFYCDTTPSPTTKYTVSGTTGAYTKDMTDLSPGTKYYFKAYATNSAGTGYGSTLDFTTTGGVSATATATGPTGSTNNTSVTLTYTYTGSPTSVKLYYTKDAGTSWTLAGEDTSVDGTFSYSITSGDGTYGWIAVAIGGGSIETDPPAGGTSPEASPLILDTTPEAVSGDYWVDDPTDAPVSGGYGEAIVGAQGKIYLAQTYEAISQDYFYSYNPATNAWSSPLSVSGLPGGGTGDFRNGAALVWDNGDYIYSLLGGRYGDSDGNRYFFYRYSISSNSWTAMASTPTSIGQQTAGGALAWVPGGVLGVSDDNYIYACLGDHSRAFARYSIKNNSWATMVDAPGGKDDGCSLVWTGDNYLFALQGEYVELGYNDAAWRYNIISNTWDLTGKFATEVGDGGSMIWTSGDYIYATSGCSSDETLRGNFYRYNFKTGLLRLTDWVPLADLPENIGDFVGCRIGFTWTSVGSSVGDIYGWRGVSGSFKFWGYMPPIPGTSWTQTDWKGGPTKSTLQVGKWSDNYDNFYDNENVNWSQAGKIMLENAPAPPPPGIADHVVISEFATNGSGAYDEFVELYNPTDHDINVENWNFWYFTEYPTGSGIYVWLYTSPYSPYSVTIGTIPIENATFHPIIKSCGFLLWANSRGYFSPGSGPTPDWTTYGNGMSDAGPRGIQLRLADNVTVVDTVVYEGEGGTSNSEAEGGKTAPNCGATTNSVERKAQSTSTKDTLFEPDGADATNGNGYDTDNNANDWVRQTNGRGPENSASPLEYPLSVAFKSAGWFESSIYDAGELADWKSVFWSESKPLGTDIIVKLRTGGDSNPYDGGWSGWYQHTNHTESTLMANGRYVQYRVEFSATDDTTTPQLSDILISYNIGIDNGPHGWIYIVGNENFTAVNGVTGGSGTVDDPYIIENWVISASSAHGITIQNTTAYFIIRNCLVENGGSTHYGIFLENAINGRIENNTCDNNLIGINLFSSSYDNLTSNTVKNSSDLSPGICLEESDYNILRNNIVLEESKCGVYLKYSRYNLLENNTVNSGWYSCIFLEYSDNNTLENNTATTGHGECCPIYLLNSDYNNLTNNIARGGEGRNLQLRYSDYNVLDGNSTRGYEGIVLIGSNYNTVRNNSTTQGWIGINLSGSNNNTLSGNISENNWLGVYLSSSSNYNLIFQNNIISNNRYADVEGCFGIHIEGDSNNNRIYHNNIINNINQACDNGSNYWDNGYPSGGNYWSDYTGVDADGDGIGDTPYYIPGGSNLDRYPLMNPYVYAEEWVATPRTTSTYDKKYPQFQVVEDNIYYVWQESDGSIWTATMNTDGTGWSATQRTISTYSKFYPQLQVVGDTIHYVLEGYDGSYYQIWTAQMNTDGTGWSITQRTTSPYYKHNPQFQVVGGNVCYAWSEYDGSTYQIWTAVLSLPDNTFTATKRTTSAYAKSEPNLQVVGGTVYYVWRESDGSYTQIWTATMNVDGTGWSAVQRTTSSYGKYHPEFQVVGDKIHFVWQEFDGSYYQIWTAALNLLDNTFTAAKRTDTPYYYKHTPRFQVVGGKIYYVWRENDGSYGQIWTATMNVNGTGWSATQRTTSLYDKCEPQFQVIDGKIHYVWQESDGSYYQIWTAVLNLTDNMPPLAPSLVSPENNAELLDTAPTFVWTSVSDPNGVAYDIQVDDDPDFSSPEVDVTGLVDNTYTSPALAYESYSWRVRAVDGAGNIGNWSDVWQFTISPGEWVATWTKQPDNNSDDWATSVAVDGDDIYVGGSMLTYSPTHGTIDFLLVKYDKDNHKLWENTWDNGSTDWFGDVAVGADGVYVVGYTCDKISGDLQGVILKYNKSDGTLAWAAPKYWGGSENHDAFFDVAVGSDGYIYVAGWTMKLNSGNADAVLLKYDNNGNIVGGPVWCGAGVANPGLTISAAGDIYLYGWNFLAKYNSSLGKQWENKALNCSPWSVAVAGDNIYVAGWRYTSTQGLNGVLQKYNAVSGTFQWENTFDNSNRQDQFLGVTTLGSDVYVTGRTGENATTKPDLILLKYDTDGTKLWQKNWGAANTYDSGDDVAIGSDGKSIYVAGCTSAPGTDIWDALLIKYNID